MSHPPKPPATSGPSGRSPLLTRDISRNLLPHTASLRDVMSVLNSGVSGAVLVVDEEGMMCGLFTDGDVRRAILAGAELVEPAERHMNRGFTFGRSSWTRQQNLRQCSGVVRHLPILDDDHRPVDMLAWVELWRLPVVRPSLAGNELNYVADCVTSNWISSQGPYVKQFEGNFAEYHGIEHALTTSNGTAALHLALIALGIGQGDEVIVPDLTFGATANVVLHAGAAPVLVDVDQRTWTLDCEAVAERINERTKAIIPVHLYGHPCDMDPLIELARQHGIVIVEDCAEALGARYRGRLVGTFGDVGCFSFFANKIITTGEGGMVITRDPALAKRMAILRDHGMSPERRYWHLYAGFNYRMTALQAAVGLAQMECIDTFLERRRDLVDRYQSHLGGVPGLTLPPNEQWADSVFWLFTILVDAEKTGLDRDELGRRLHERGIETRPMFPALQGQPPFPPQATTNPVSAWLSERGLSLPTGNDIGCDDVDRVCHELLEVLGHESEETS